jgi:dTDP-4-dehydrorhamnose 3,5-epimerase-like enzyme
MDTPLIEGLVIQALKTHRDPRGSVFEPLDDAELAGQRNVHVVLTQPNGVRGNHVHRTAVEITTVVGPCLARFKDAQGTQDIDIPDGETWRFRIPAGVVHAFRNTGDSVMVLVSFSSNLHDPTGADSRREQIL